MAPFDRFRYQNSQNQTPLETVSFDNIILFHDIFFGANIIEWSYSHSDIFISIWVPHGLKWNTISTNLNKKWKS